MLGVRGGGFDGDGPGAQEGDVPHLGLVGGGQGGGGDGCEAGAELRADAGADDGEGEDAVVQQGVDHCVWKGVVVSECGFDWRKESNSP